jgi:transposase-like protein
VSTCRCSWGRPAYHTSKPQDGKRHIVSFRLHFLRNLLCRVPKSAQGLVATLVRSIFAQPDAASTWAQHARIVEQLEGRFPAAAELLAEAAGELLAFTAFPWLLCQAAAA